MYSKNLKAKKSFGTQAKASILSLFSSLALFSCAPSYLDERGSALYSTDQSQLGFSGSPSACPVAPNITPAEIRAVNGTSYTACPGLEDNQVQILGSSRDERMVCVFPIEFVSATQYVYRADPSGLPRSGCYDSVSFPSLSMEFNGLTFNGVIIVDGSLRASMTSALLSGRDYPLHSIGRFR